MTKQSYTATIEVAKSPPDVFACIQDVSKWWGGKDLKGSTRKQGDVFTIRHGDVHYSKQELVEVMPDRRVVILISESTLNWLERDKHEWRNTRLIFQITPGSGTSVLQFTHEGLVPEMECYARCAQGWDMVIKNWLFHFITDGTPHFREDGPNTMGRGDSPAVTVALAHIEAWTNHDWASTRAMLAPDVHAAVVSTQPGFGGGEMFGVDDYMAKKTRAAQLIEPGSVQVLSAVGDEQNALVTTTFRIAIRPGGRLVTMARACLYALDDGGRIKDERDEFLLLSEPAPKALPPDRGTAEQVAAQGMRVDPPMSKPTSKPTVVQFEITGRDPERLQRFYRELFGWPLRATPGGQTAAYLRTSDEETGLPGAIGPTRSGPNAARQADWDGGTGQVTVYVEVEDVDRTIARGVELGAELISPTHQVPGKPLKVAFIADPEGHVVALSQGLKDALKQTGYAK